MSAVLYRRHRRHRGHGDVRAFARFIVRGAVALALVAAPVLAAGCDSTEAPTLCVFSASDLGAMSPGEMACPSPEAGESEPQCGAVGADEVFYIRHEIPDGVTPPEPLEVRVQSPCGESKLEVPYVDGVALVSMPAPRGAGCSLVITAAIANSELRCSFGDPSGAGCAPDLCAEDEGAASGP